MQWACISAPIACMTNQSYVLYPFSSSLSVAFPSCSPLFLLLSPLLTPCLHRFPHASNGPGVSASHPISAPSLRADSLLRSHNGPGRYSREMVRGWGGTPMYPTCYIIHSTVRNKFFLNNKFRKHFDLNSWLPGLVCRKTSIWTSDTNTNH